MIIAAVNQRGSTKQREVYFFNLLMFCYLLSGGEEGGRGYFTVLNSLADTRSRIHAFGASCRVCEQRFKRIHFFFLQDRLILGLRLKFLFFFAI